MADKHEAGCGGGREEERRERGNVREREVGGRKEEEQMAKETRPLCLPLKSSLERTRVLHSLKSFCGNSRGSILPLGTLSWCLSQCGRHNQAQQCAWLKTIEMDFLTILETGSPGSSCQVVWLLLRLLLGLWVAVLPLCPHSVFLCASLCPNLLFL